MKSVQVDRMVLHKTNEKRAEIEKLEERSSLCFGSRGSEDEFDARTAESAHQIRATYRSNCSTRGGGVAQKQVQRGDRQLIPAEKLKQITYDKQCVGLE